MSRSSHRVKGRWPLAISAIRSASTGPIPGRVARDSGQAVEKKTSGSWKKLRGTGREDVRMEEEGRADERAGPADGPEAAAGRTESCPLPWAKGAGPAAFQPAAPAAESGDGGFPVEPAPAIGSNLSDRRWPATRTGSLAARQAMISTMAPISRLTQPSPHPRSAIRPAEHRPMGSLRPARQDFPTGATRGYLRKNH